MYCRTIAIFALLALPAASQAHAIVVKAVQSGGLVRVDVTFDTEDPAEDAEVVIIATADGRVVTQGKTDRNGLFAFPTPKPGEYEIVADAGSGHRATTKLTITAHRSDAESTAPQRPGTGTKETNILLGLVVILAVTMFWNQMRKRKRKGIITS